MTETKTCATCKHWSDEDQAWRTADLHLHECTRIPMVYDASYWDDEGRRVLKPEHRHTTAFVQDASDYDATLYTLGNFGCSLWEQK